MNGAEYIREVTASDETNACELNPFRNPLPSRSREAFRTTGVVIAVYNGAAYVNRALASVHAQTTPLDEVLVVDDGSTDATLELLASWTPRLPIRILRNHENLGLARSLNRGLAESRCDLVFRLDADDFWLDDHVRNLKAAIGSESGIVLAAAGIYVQDVDGTRRPKSPPTARGIRRRLMWDNPLTHSAVCFDRAVVTRLGGYDVRQTFEDYDLYVRLLALGNFVASREHTAVYVVSPNSLSRIGKARSLAARFQVQRQAIMRYFPRHPFAAVIVGLVSFVRVILSRRFDRYS